MLHLIQQVARRTADAVGRESRLVRALRPAYERTLGIAAGRRGIPWEINGTTYRIDPRYRHQLGAHYDPPVAAFLRDRVRPGAVCVDVGANVGVYVLQFAHWAGDRGRVIAFEPNPAARLVLERHVRFNHLTHRVTIVPAAVGAALGEATLFTFGADGRSRLAKPNRELGEGVTPMVVPVVTLDEHCSAAAVQPDWLLIDIEGFEIAALEGARDIVHARGRDLGIVVEMHPGAWASAGTSRAHAESVLYELGRRTVALTGQSDPLADHGLVSLEFVRG
jgi:FkbM family methyltransferase